jgi:ubiquinone/menaquinone biosynthesis C-methylase UbiE
MQNLSLKELETTAAHYEKLMVPAIFTEWAERVLDEADVQQGDRVLDVACGTGIVARHAVRRTGNARNSEIPVIMVHTLPDWTPIRVCWQWLKKGRRRSCGKRVRQKRCPSTMESFDVVVSQFGLMFFQDRPAALREMARVLAPGGRMVVAVFDSLDNNPGYAALAECFRRCRR